MFMIFGDGNFIKYKDTYVVQASFNGPGTAVSLGMFTFLFRDYGEGQWKEQVIKHEYGHSIQSKILGPSFLLIIGLPSITWNIFFRKFRRKRKISYYSFYTEKWADKLGNVIR